jgi:hypothetical protein
MTNEKDIKGLVSLKFLHPWLVSQQILALILKMCFHRLRIGDGSQNLGWLGAET